MKLSFDREYMTEDESARFSREIPLMMGWSWPLQVEPIYHVEMNPHIGLRGEGRNRWVIYFRHPNGVEVIAGKYMTRYGAEAEALRLNRIRAKLIDMDLFHTVV